MIYNFTFTKKCRSDSYCFEKLFISIIITVMIASVIAPEFADFFLLLAGLTGMYQGIDIEHPVSISSKSLFDACSKKLCRIEALNYFFFIVKWSSLMELSSMQRFVQLSVGVCSLIL